MASAAPPLSRYSLQKELSNKSGRRTFLAIDRQTEERVIIKIIHPGLGDSPQERLRHRASEQWTDLKLFEREATILQQLDHPAIPTYKTHFQTEFEGIWSFVLVQSYLDAPSLASLVDQGKYFSEAEVRAIARRLLKTLVYLHQQLPPVVHRDIKPSNVLLKLDAFDRIEQVYLVDFGAVQITSSRDSGTMTIVGSYGYMPLEQFLGKTSPSSDLYSLGMTMVYLLTGKHPAELEQANGRIDPETLTVRNSLDGRVSDSPGERLSDRMMCWLRLLIHPYPEQRIDSAEVMLRMVQQQTTNAGYFPHLKPIGSKVCVQRDRTELRIITPRAQSGCGIAFIILVAVFVFTGYIGPVVLIMSLIALIVWLIFRHYYGSNEKETYSLLSIHRTVGLRTGKAKAINPDHISQINWRGNSVPFDNISLLTYNAGHTFKNYTQTGKKRKNKAWITLPPSLSIHAGRTEYPLKQMTFTKAELLWLGQELSDFLHLPIQMLHPREAGSIQETPQPSMRRVTQTFRIRPDASHTSANSSSNTPANKEGYRHDASDTFDF
ncbi:MAG: serine/threonine-protein kinase [Cyanobacteria bacterium P01_F01_bin.3]